MMKRNTEKDRKNQTCILQTGVNAEETIDATLKDQKSDSHLLWRVAGIQLRALPKEAFTAVAPTLDHRNHASAVLCDRTVTACFLLLRVRSSSRDEMR